MSGVPQAVRTLSMFLFARYPFVNAVTFLMLLAERSHREDYPPMYPKVIYAHMGIFLFCGVCMGFNYVRKEAALIHVGQLFYLAVAIYTNEDFNYKEWVKIKMVHRMIGVAGFFLLYAYFTTPPRKRNPQLLRIGETVIGLYLICAMYSSVESPEDRAAFVKLVPGGEYALYVYVMMLAACILCYLPGMYVHDVSQGLVIVLALATIFVDSNLHYWSKKRGMDYWNQVRLLADNIAIIVGLLMYLSSTKKPVYGEPKQEKSD